ncbi:hypothetical protein O181_019118 [Austropuccinia psidii MF-1]|uniref:Uncharacterized protein n=1 Tax=Austropuccinia psidii MF-1 TaxID=1389203 RepID=A0A9Q3C934_9BASI|nr:hypothetical protein [Austropuccinia psidii MF-1]
MDLPPSSYHDSLEELWDGEETPEEIGTMMKVVPSVYSHYLDAFSELEADTLPPHCTCDHHIELEGSLPPFFQENQFTDQVPVFPSRRKLLESFTNSKRHSPQLQSFSTHHWRDQCIQLCLGCCTESGLFLRKTSHCI